MRPQFHDLAEKGRVRRHPLYPPTKCGDREGVFLLRCPVSPSMMYLTVIASDGSDWAESGFDPPAFEHVSVTVKEQDRYPTWLELCWVKGLFWGDEELVIQYHPPKSKYVNVHKGCLHLWRAIGVEIPIPPAKTLA